MSLVRFYKVVHQAAPWPRSRRCWHDQNFNPERLFQVLVGPQVSEKAPSSRTRTSRSCSSSPDATKPEVKAESSCCSRSRSVQIANLRARSSASAAAQVAAAIPEGFRRLKPGQEINFAGGLPKWLVVKVKADLAGPP